MKKKLCILILALTLTLALATPAAAYDTAEQSRANTVSAGYGLNAVIDESGSLWVWGSNDFGQLGNGGGGNMVEEDGAWDAETDTYYPTYYQTVPVKIMDDVVSISADGIVLGNTFYTRVAAAVKSDGTLWTWGCGNLGNGGSRNATVYSWWGESFEIQNEPVQIMDHVSAVSVGGYCSLAIKTDGSLWMWGSTTEISSSSDVPAKVMDDVVSACAGPLCAAAIKSDGSLWMWGTDSLEWLGISEIPQKVMDNAAAVSIGTNAISVDAPFVAAVKTDGSLWMWGADINGVGISNEYGSSTPVKIMDDVASVSAGCDLVAVIKTDGSLWTWGRNNYGQLGNGTADSSTVPIKVMDGAAAVSAGANSMIAVKTDGSIWTWGAAYLGNGTTEDSSVPVRVPELTAMLSDSSTLPSSVTTPPAVSATPTAYATSYSILVDGKAVAFDAYALRDENGNDTNYLKLRDVAHVLNGSAAQFDVGWDGASGSISITTGMAYANPNGSEMSTPFSGDQAYAENSSAIRINGVQTDLSAITLTDAGGGAYTYFKLRDLGQALGFDVDWDNDAQAIVINTTRPYSE